MAVPLIEHPYGVNYDGESNKSLKKIEEFKQESKGNMTAIWAHLQVLLRFLILQYLNYFSSRELELKLLMSQMVYAENPS